MEKKQYSSPAMRVVKIQVRRQMLNTSVRGMGDNSEVGYGGASKNNTGGEVRSNGHRGIWDGMEWNRIRHAAGGSGATIKRTILNFGDGDATGIGGLTPAPSPKDEGSTDWYDLSGRKLDSRPTAKGVYIVNGKKIVI